MRGDVGDYADIVHTYQAEVWKVVSDKPSNTNNFSSRVRRERSTSNKKQGNKTKKRMKTLNSSFTSSRLMRKLGVYLAATATVAIVSLTTSAWLSRANAEQHYGQSGYDREAGEWLLATYNKAQTAEILQLLADFHEDISYGGNLTALMNLWADNSSLVFNGTTNSGKAGVQAFFANGGPFHNNWASLAPEYKTQITVSGDEANFVTQCVFIDLSVTPMVVKSVVQVTGRAEKVHGKWIFKSMNNSSPAPL